ncbi:hypothetical protein N7488_002985 [Penicillium malachiteum]|nr:hypothetical protein N7488_002985 [Penicillium malachiteum]
MADFNIQGPSTSGTTFWVHIQYNWVRDVGKSDMELLQHARQCVEDDTVWLSLTCIGGRNFKITDQPILSIEVEGPFYETWQWKKAADDLLVRWGENLKRGLVAPWSRYDLFLGEGSSFNHARVGIDSLGYHARA